jgi:hypothetical protein
MKKTKQTISCVMAGVAALVLISGISVYCQTPGYFTYQAALRDGSGNIMANTNASIQLFILQGNATGTEVYNETNSVTTNAFGLVSLEVGSKDSAGFSAINWALGPYFIKVMVNGTEMGTSQLLSVPYAFLAKSFLLPYEDSVNASDAVFKITNSGEGVGIYGKNSVTDTAAVYAESPRWALKARASGIKGRAVTGIAMDINSIGVYGLARAANSTGVWGEGGKYDFFANGSGIHYGDNSSIRWKKNITAIPQPLEKIRAIRGVYFDWDQSHGGRHDVGMIAEEVGKVLPEVVAYEENGADASGMDYSKTTPLLLEGIKAMLDEIESLKAENDRLLQRIVVIEHKLK